MTSHMPNLILSRTPVNRHEYIVVGALIGGILLSRAHSYLLFHTLVEFFGISVYLTGFALAWNTRRHLEDGFLRVMGLAMGPVAMVFMLHAMAYKGVGIFPADANLPTALWVAGRALQVAAMTAATCDFFQRQSSPRIALCAAAGAALLAALVFGGYFPVCYVEGQGLTPFKIGAEYAMMAASLAAAWRFWRADAARPTETRQLGTLILLINCLESGAFTLYVDVYGVMNMAGHLLGLIAALLTYALIAWMGLARPQEVLYSRLAAQKERFANDARRANQEILRFSEVLAHHMQEPVRLQYLFCQRLRQLLPAPLPEEAEQALHAVMAGALRQRALLRDAQRYLAVSDSPPVAQTGDARRAFHSATLRLVAKFAESGAVATGDETLPPVRLDERYLTEVFVILLDNAIDFRRDETPLRIEVAARRVGSMVEFSLTDNGRGAPAAFHARAFDVFERLEPSPGDGRTGIGLAVAKKIIAAVGGRIWMEDAPEQGARIRFTLPAADGETPVTASAPV